MGCVAYLMEIILPHSQAVHVMYDIYYHNLNIIVCKALSHDLSHTFNGFHLYHVISDCTFGSSEHEFTLTSNCHLCTRTTNKLVISFTKA